MTNKEILEEYFSIFELRGCSPATIRNIKYDFNQFFKILNNKHYEKITTSDIRDYLREKKKTVKLITIRNKITVISAFFNWLANEGHIKENPARLIQKPRVNDNERRYLTIEEIEIIRLDITEPFDILLFEVLYSSGIRVSEAVNLDWDDIDFEKEEMVVLGKGNKKRTVKFSTKAKLLLLRYKDKRKDDDQHVFRSCYKQRMSKETIERRVGKIGERAGIKIRITPHKLRHSFATTLAKRNTPIEVIQALMGHEDINTTKRYIEISQENVSYNYNQAFM